MREIRSAVDPLSCVFKVGDAQKQVGFSVKDSGGEVRYKKEALWVADLEKREYRNELIQEARSCLEAQGIALLHWSSA